MQPIFKAILQNDLPAFLGLVEERESSLEERNEEERLNNTVLHMATKLGHRELVSKIIDLRPSLVCTRNVYGNTPLHLAALFGDVNIVVQMLETGLEACTARNINNDTPLHLGCRSNSMEAGRLIAEKTQSIGLDELNFAISRGYICIATIILDRFPDLAREEAWVVEDGSQSTLLHYACDRVDFELTSILLGIDQRLEEALNTNGLTPLHVAVRSGSVVLLKEFLDKVPLSFSSLTPSKETVFHLAAQNKDMDAFEFMSENLGINSQILLQQTDENGNTVLHIAASVACNARLIRYILGKKIVDYMYKNEMGFEAFQLLPREAEDFELLSRWLRFGTVTSEELNSENNEEYEGHSNPSDKESLGPLGPLDICTRSHDDKVLRLLRLIRKNTSKIVERKKRKEHKVERGRESLEYEMHIEECKKI